MLAGLQRVFGEGVSPILWMNLFFAVGVLVLFFQILRLDFPLWVAIGATGILGYGGEFHLRTSDVLTDVPALFWEMLWFYGLRGLEVSHGRWSRVGFGILMVLGMGMSALIRPTFWILLLGVVIYVGWRAYCSYRWRIGWSVGVSAFIALGLVLVWNFSELNPLEGEYGRTLISRFSDVSVVWDRVVRGVGLLFEEALPSAFLGVDILPGLNTLLILMALSGAVLLFWFSPLFAVMIWVVIVSLLLLGIVPRYFLMIQPMLVLGWLLAFYVLTRKLDRFWGPWVMAAGLLFLVGPNVGALGRHVYHQQYTPFLERLDHGRWIDTFEMARLVERFVKRDERVIVGGLDAKGKRRDLSRILTYVSRRDVLAVDSSLSSNSRWRRWVDELDRLDVHWAILPASRYELGLKGRELIDKGMIVPVRTVGRVGESLLVRVVLRKPVKDEAWRGRMSMEIGDLSLLTEESSVATYIQMYRQGEWVRWWRLSDWMQQTIGPDDVMVMPRGASAWVSYFSGRKILDEQGDLDAYSQAGRWPETLRDARVSWCVMSVTAYQEGSPVREMIQRGVIRPRGRVFEVEGLRVSRVEILIPPRGVHWREWERLNEE